MLKANDSDDDVVNKTKNAQYQCVHSYIKSYRVIELYIYIYIYRIKQECKNNNNKM